MIRCPKCRIAMRVVDSRMQNTGAMIRRRLECSECLHRYTSFEVKASMMDSNDKVGFYMAVNRAKEQARINNKFGRQMTPNYQPIGLRKRRRTIFQSIKELVGC